MNSSALPKKKKRQPNGFPVMLWSLHKLELISYTSYLDNSLTMKFAKSLLALCTVLPQAAWVNCGSHTHTKRLTGVPNDPTIFGNALNFWKKLETGWDVSVTFGTMQSNIVHSLLISRLS